MNRLLFGAASLLGAVAILWMGASFLGGHALALGVTLLIAIAYGIGLVELFHYRRATASLERALAAAPTAPARGDAGERLGTWLQRVHPALQHAVRQRVEGGRAGLPVPVFTPYLVGLLVMLGLLGTFFGMVDTLSGAVTALQGNTELDAIRAGLAAPIAGLGVAFGTSVAGVAASAMLGLASTLSRRDRLLAARTLDHVARRAFPDCAVDYRRQQAFEAMQLQSAALPAIVERLDTLSDKLARMGSDINDTLATNQALFHETAGSDFRQLADKVGATLEQSLAESGRLAGESLRAPLETAMAQLVEHSERSQAQMAEANSQQLASLAEGLADTVQRVETAVAEGVATQSRENSRFAQALSTSLTDRSAELTDRLASTTSELNRALSDASGEMTDTLSRTAGELVETVSRASSGLADSLAQTSEEFKATYGRASEEFSSTLARTAGEVGSAQRNEAEALVAEVARLLGESEELVRARVASEQAWLAGHDARMASLADTLAGELEALRDAEAERAEAAVERLAGLETAVAGHLAELGRELEAPMARLIETASETPRAAAEVIAQLREELSNSIERDNHLLEERQQVLAQLQSLMASLEASATEQRDAVARMVESSAGTLESVGERFGEQVDAGVGQLSSLAEDLAGGAVEVASLGEAFQAAVREFGESNRALMDGLARIEEALEQSSARSDEQLGYYVAQAREIIDHSVLSQKEIIEQLRQLGRQEELFETEAG